MKKQTSLITLSLMLATPALAGGAGAPVAGGGASTTCRTIAQIVSTDPQFSTLLTAVQAAGLAETLASGQYTVFAPTNAAFAKLPSDQLAAVLNDPEMLRGVLLYHVVPGKVTSKQVASLRSVKTAQGANLTVSVMGSRVMINDANVTRADVAACNGVIHVIDTVLLPPMAAATPAPAAAAPAPAAPEPAAPATTTETTTTTDTAATAPAPAPTAPAAVDLTSIPALPVTGATVTSTGTTTTTDTSTAGTTTDTTTATTDTSATTADTTATTTETTTTDTAATDTSATTTETTATGTTTTETTTADTAAPATNTLYDVIVSDERFSTLRDLLSDAGLTETLTTGEYTIFAPTNEAFNAISDDQLAALLDNPELLRRILTYHVVQGRVSAEQLAGGAVLTTVEGSPLTPSRSGSAQLVGTATVGEAVNTASNGTIYVINQVLLPPGVTLPAPAATTETATTTDTAAAATTTDTTAAATATTTTDTAAATTTATTTTATTTVTPAAGTTLVTLLTSDPRFSTLAGLIQQAGLAETLAGGEYTVFAPTNDAFAKIPAADLAAITGDPARLRAVLLYHVVQGRQTSEQLAAATQLTSAQGGALALNLNGTTQVVGGANVSERLDTASNGTVYVIDTVLLPPNP